MSKVKGIMRTPSTTTLFADKRVVSWSSALAESMDNALSPNFIVGWKISQKHSSIGLPKRAKMAKQWI